MKRIENRIGNVAYIVFETNLSEGILGAVMQKPTTVDNFKYDWFTNQGMKIVCVANANYFNPKTLQVYGGVYTDKGFLRNPFSTHPDYTTLIHQGDKLILDAENNFDKLNLKYPQALFMVQMGPTLVKDGVAFKDTSNFGHANEITDRGFIGQKTNGDIIIFTTTHDTGCNMKTLQKIALDLDCVVAINRDGGESAQTEINGEMVNGNKRAVPVSIMFLAKNFVLENITNVKKKTFDNFLNDTISDGVKFKDLLTPKGYIYLDKDIWDMLGMSMSYDSFLNTNFMPNFTYRELSCNQRNQVYIDKKSFTHALHLQEAREYLGKGFRINSWFRTLDYNKSVGGATASKHILGIATDISLGYYDRIKLRNFWKAKGWGGIGIYSNFIHVDSRGYLTEWKG